MSESDTSTGDEYETDSDIEDQAPPGTWRYVTTEVERVEVDDVGSFLLAKAREESSTVIGRLLQKMFGTSDHHLPGVDVECFINAWLDPTILASLKNYANKSLREADAVTIDDVFQLIEVELWLCFYGITPDAFYSAENAKCYPPAAAVMPLAKYRSLLVALGISNPQHRSDTSHWNAPFTPNRDISNTMEQIRRFCSDVGFVNDITIASLDDDMLRLRSQLVDDCGLAHVRNPKKGYGPVHHGIVSVVTGFYLGGHIAGRGESNIDVVRILQRSLCGASTENQISLPGILHALDRGYQSHGVNQQIVESGGFIVGTHKRTGRFPFTYDRAGTRFQRLVTMKGERAAYWATQRLPTPGLPNVLAHALAYRSGLGKVALCYTTNPDVGPGCWSYVTSSPGAGDTQSPSDIFAQFEDGVDRITMTQRTPDWFLLRKFRITGSVAVNIFRAVARCGNAGDTPADDPDIQTVVLLLALGRTRAAHNELQSGRPTSLTRAELVVKSGEELKTLCRSASLPAYGTKSAMIDRLLGQGEERVQQAELTIEEEILAAWFMKPVSTSDMKIGSANEDRIAEHITTFLDLHSEYHIEGLKAYGLLCKKSMPVAAFSPDNVASVVSVGRGRMYAILEYKTRTKPTTEEKERRMAAKYGAFTSVEVITDGFGGSFTDLIPDVSHRVVCGGIQDGFIVYASPTCIIRVVHVFVGVRVSWTYRSALKAIQHGYMGWIYDSEPVPTFDPRQLGNCVDQQTLVQTLGLWKAIVKIVDDRRRPLPAAKHILPSLIALWNRVKGGIDVYSRFLKNVKAKHFRLSPTGVIWLRMIMTLVYNAYQSFLLFRSNSFLMNRSLCTSYKAYQKFKQNLPSFKDFCRDAASVVSKRSIPVSNRGAVEAVKPDTTQTRASFAYKKHIHFEKEKEWRDLRMSDFETHRMVAIEGGFQRCCELCCRLNHDAENMPHARKGFKTRYACEVCQVSLCKIKRWNGVQSCFEKFHAERKLADPCKHGEEMELAKTNVNRAPPPSRKRSQSSEAPNRRAPSIRLQAKQRRRSLRLQLAS